jgi:MFS family permease
MTPLAPAAPPAPPAAAWLRKQAGYGWLTILIGAAAMAATYPGRTHGLGMVTEPLLTDLGLADPDGRVFYSSLNLWGTLIGSLFCLPVGWLYDRLNPRLLLAGNLIALGAAVWWMSGVTTWQGLFAGLVLTRGLGQSALSVVSITLVAKAFRPAQLGLAMAWYSVLSAPFHLLLIRLVGDALKAGTDWRTVWATVGACLAGLAVTAALLARQRSPAAVPEDRPEDAGYTVWQALATPAFWVVAVTISLWGLIYAGVALFNEDIFKERGFPREVYFDVLSLVTVVALASKLLFGWLTRRVSLLKLLAVCLLATAGSLAGLPLATRTWHVYLYGVGLGVASGAVALLFFAAWGKFYGHRDLGRIQGVAQMLTVFASAAGPLVQSAGRRYSGSYAAVFTALAVGVLVLAVLAWFTPLPRPHPEEES